MASDSAPGHDVIVVGASAGGVHTLVDLVGQLPGDLPAAVFVAQHLAPQTPSMLGEILDKRGPLPARAAEDEEPIAHGRIYVAPPDRHLLVKAGCVRVTRGPRENRARPAIDPLFRSAAVAYGPRVVGVILSGMLDDGVAGLAAVKKCGGVSVVQDPEEALYPPLPRNAIEGAPVDHQLPVAGIARLLGELARTPPAEGAPPPPAFLALEVEIAERVLDSRLPPDRLGPATRFTCPECGGAVYEVEGDAIARFRCHVGHAYTADTLLADQAEAVEQTLWAAMRAMIERAQVYERMARDERERGRAHSAARFEENAREARGHAGRLQDLLLRRS